MSVLISDEYRELNRRLHETHPNYGRHGDRHAVQVALMATEGGCETILDYGCGKASLATALGQAHDVRNYDPAIPAHATDPVPADLVVCTDVLEHIEPERLDAVLQHLANLTRKRAFIVICTAPDCSKTLPDGRNPHLIVRPLAWWLTKLDRYFEIDRMEMQGRADAVFDLCPMREGSR